MPRDQINLRCPASELKRFRRAAKGMGYGEREFSAWVRTACAIYADLLELDDAHKQHFVELRRELELAKREASQ